MESNHLTAFPKSLTAPISLDILIVSYTGRFVKGFFNFFLASRLHHHSCASGGFSVDYLPLTLQIIAHPIVECNRQNVQNRDFYFPKLCATFLLTNCWRCVIMEILRASPVGAPPKKPPQKWGGFRISWAVRHPWTEASSEPCPRLTYTLRGAESLPPAVPPGRTLPRRCWE